MASKVLLGIADDDLALDVRALVVEGIDLEVVGTASSGPAVVAACEQDEIDVVLLHEGLGPLPLLHLARDLGTRFPTLGVVLLVDDPTPEILRGAMQAGARGVASLPLTVDALEADLSAAAFWSQSMRSQLAGERRGAERGGSAARMVAVAGAKGGAGTTTVALSLALETVAAGPKSRSVCLVDFDLQAGDVVNYLDLQHRRSVIDLLEVADDLSPRHLEEALYPHPTGLHLLLAPQEGEQAEDVSSAHARHILGAIRGRFDVVIVDVGTVVTEGSAVATELADLVLLVTTPDVPSMRSANRLLQMWERLDVRKDGVEVVVNRASKISDVQAELVERVVAAPRAPVAIPADYKGLQPAINSGSPSRAADSSVREALRQLGAHIGLWQGQHAGGSSRRSRLRRGDHGQSAVEVVGVAPFVLLIVALAFQLGVVGLTFVFAGHAASEGARQLAVGKSMGEAQTHAADRIPDRWSQTLTLSSGASGPNGRRTVEASVRIPMIVPGFNPDVRVDSDSGYVLESDVAGETP